MNSVGIMQPYFFPYLGYFSLIRATDQWVVFDPVQFIRHGWIERNRVLNSEGEWQYIKVPLIKHSRDTLINQIKIRNTEKWQEKILAQLTCYKKKAPYYIQVVDLLKNAFQYNSDSITELNVRMLAACCDYLGVSFDYCYYNDLNIHLGSKEMKAGDWSLEIAKHLGADTYINPVNGQELFDKQLFHEEGIRLVFLKNKLSSYNQKKDTFEAGLSILDVMMFNSKEETLAQIDDYELIEA